jgi:Protein of unknown function, DUF547
MKANFLILFIMLGASVAVSADLKSFTSDANAFFAKYVENGSVAYVKIKSQIAEADNLYKQIGDMRLAGLDDNSKKTFYINAYNVIVIYWVAKHYPLKSPLDNSGFFDKVKHVVAGEEMTLNALEIKKLLQPYKDARVHFVLACAAKSCPPLASFSYTPEKVDQQLTERTGLAVNNKEWIKMYPTQKKVELSKIFDWYKGDFNTNGKSAIDWINQYRKEKIPGNYEVGYYEYNWALNERK